MVTIATLQVMKKLRVFPVLILAACTMTLLGCGVYTMRDISIPPEVKTIKINFIENRASYVNPQLSPRLTNRLQEKVVNQTRLNRTNEDDADWVISGYINEYRVSTSGISNQQASMNRLSVGCKITLKDNLTQKTTNYDVIRNFEFNAAQSLQQAEQAMAEDILKGLSEEIFNRLFSNW